MQLAIAICEKIISIVALIAVLSVYSLMAIGSGEAKTSVESSDNTAVTTVAEAGDTSAEVTTAAENTSDRVNVGEKLTVDNFEINYVSAEDYTDYSEYFAPADGNKIIRLYFECTNNRDSDVNISSFYFTCYADNDKCEAYYYASDDALSATVSTGRNCKGAIYFEVPENAESIEVEYDTSLFSNKKAIFVVK